MKEFKFNSTFLITLLIFFTLSSCDKDDDTNQEEEPQQSSCLINTIYDDGDVIYQFTYDESAKIIKATAWGNTLNYQYSGNSIIVEGKTPSGEFAGKATYLLNAKGFVTYVHAEHNEAGTSWTDSQYEYENDNKLIKYISTNSTTGSQPFVQTYTWQNGNIIASETGTGKITTYTYYLDMPKQYGGYYSYMDLIGSGAKIFDTKNELKSASLDGITTTISYQTDDDGKIMVMMLNDGTTASSISYGYQCD